MTGTPENNWPDNQWPDNQWNDNPIIGEDPEMTSQTSPQPDWEPEQVHEQGWRDDEAAAPRTPPRPTGPSWGTVALGLICLLIAGGSFWIEWANLEVDWSRSGPLTVVAIGAVLVLVGLLALLRRNDPEDADLS